MMWNMARMGRHLLLGLMLVACGTEVGAKPPPLSIDQLREHHEPSTLVFERALPPGDGYSAALFSYKSAGLKVYALVATPNSPPSAAGFPVLVANHGFHPNPKRYGITAGGVDSRPGDYYRIIPTLFAKRGFLVVMPDYRGHNSSEGFEFTEGFLASGYYTEDVLALVSGLGALKGADLRNVFMWGHSLGGEVTLRALLATNRVKGASLWSSVGGDVWDQAYFFSRYENPNATDSRDTPKAALDKLHQDIASLGTPYEWATREPLRYLDCLTTPLIIHHALGDRSANYDWSTRLAKELLLGGHPYVFYTYDGSDHFLQAPQIDLAADRDAAFFATLMIRAGTP